MALLSTSKRNVYHGFLLWSKGCRYVVLTALPPSYADCLEILGASTSWSSKGLSRPVCGLLCFMFSYW